LVPCSKVQRKSKPNVKSVIERDILRGYGGYHRG
jgi:hypothetical protein